MNVPRRMAAAVMLGLLAAMASLYLPVPRSRLSPLPLVSLRLLDRNGEIMREVLSSREGRCRWIELSELRPELIKAVLAAEDRMFFYHPGINPAAVVKALWNNLRAGRVVSGASTLTQQVARSLCGHSRTMAAKLHEAWIALRLEKRMSKEEILTQYLNRIEFGNLTYGIEAASRLYFDKSASHLSLAEACFLVALPRAPTRMNPYRFPETAAKRQRVVLDRLRRLGWIEEDEWRRALAEPLKIVPETQAFRAPHFCDFILEKMSKEQRTGRNTIRTTLDLRLQSKVEILVRNHLKRLKDRRIDQAAVVVLDNRDAGIRCMVGSRDFFDFQAEGQVNGAAALRQPGSTLKPFTYGLALEHNLTAATLLEDRPVEFATPAGRYRPQNYDRTFHGPVRLRSALACSYNIPAVLILDTLGPDALYHRLREAGFDSLRRGSGFYGVGLTLGNGEVTLLELAQAYSALARRGRFRPAVWMGEENRDPPAPGPRIFSEKTAYILTDILSDADARVPAFGYGSVLGLPFPCAVKTGTSKDFRDNWTVGYTTDVTVAVWVGNFDGGPMRLVSGVTGCGPLFRDVMLLIHHRDPPPEFPEPGGLKRVRICPWSGLLASPSCPGAMDEIFIEGTEPRKICAHDSHPSVGEETRLRLDPRLPAVVFPVQGDVFKMDPVLRRDYQVIRLRAALPASRDPLELEWWMNGKLLGRSRDAGTFPWNLSPGSYTIHVVVLSDGRRISSRPVSFRVFP